MIDHTYMNYFHQIDRSVVSIHIFVLENTQYISNWWEQYEYELDPTATNPAEESTSHHRNPPNSKVRNQKWKYPQVTG